MADDQYFDMNSGAHRRQPPPIAAPALIWHRAYWRPTHESSYRDSKQIEKDEAAGLDLDRPWHNEIDTTLAKIFRYLKPTDKSANFVCPNYSRDNDTLMLFSNKVSRASSPDWTMIELEAEERSVRHGIFFIRIKYFGAHLVISARRHLEYVVFLFALDFSETFFEEEDDDQSIKATWNAFNDLHNLVFHRFTEFTKNPSRRDITLLESKVEAESKYTVLVATFEKLIEEKIVNKALGQERNGRAQLNGCGSLFADFIGVIYSAGLDPEASNLSFANHPTDSGVLRASVRAGGTNFLADNRGERVLDAVWPVITSIGRDRQRELQYGEPEYAVSAFNRGETIYVSSLGGLTPNMSNEHLPLFYTLIVSYASSWRLGRFIDRLNSMGTLRIAALRDLQEINRASNDIRTLSGYFGQDGVGNHGTDVAWARKRFKGIGKSLEFGLKYRVEKSMYYVSSFNSTKDSLHGKPIAGFQFYDDFIRNRVTDAFAYIHGVGRRYDEVQRDINFQGVQNQRLQMETQMLAATRQTVTMTHLLQVAEVIGIIPITYYGGNILIYVMKDLHLKFSFTDYTSLTSFIIAGLIAIGLAVASHRATTRLLKRNDAVSRNLNSLNDQQKTLIG